MTCDMRIIWGLFFVLTLSPLPSRASSDEFVGAMASQVLGFAMVAERFPSTVCGKYVKNANTMRLYQDSEKKVLTLLSPRLRRELVAILSDEPDLVRRSAERLLVPINQLSADSEREGCLMTAAMIISMHKSSLQILENYAAMVGMK